MLLWVAAITIVVITVGCAGPQRMMGPVLPAVPLETAAGVVNENIASISGTVRASGSVDGYFTNDRGRRVRYSASGVLFYLAPSYVRFDLKKLGDRQFLFGSNKSDYWIYSREDERFFCGRLNEPKELRPRIPIRPEQIPAALGLAPISTAGGGRSGGLTHRVSAQYQKVFFATPSAGGRTRVEKEYWLDRRAPRLIRRVVFRDANGNVSMISELSDYRSIGRGGPLLPHSMIARWPGEGAEMRFDVGRWELVPQVGPEGLQFATPQECELKRSAIQ
jgi:hypothetical protein